MSEHFVWKSMEHYLWCQKQCLTEKDGELSWDHTLTFKSFYEFEKHFEDIWTDICMGIAAYKEQVDARRARIQSAWDARKLSRATPGATGATSRPRRI